MPSVRIRTKTTVKPKSMPKTLIALVHMRIKSAINNTTNLDILKNIIFAAALSELINLSTLRTIPLRVKTPNNPPAIIPSGSFFHSKKADDKAFFSYSYENFHRIKF